ncbi:MAG: 4-hydroxy-tetrahydrodipicolinate synthase [Nocardioides sp.]
MTNSPFGTVLTAMATAFTTEGTLDLDATQAVARHLVAHGHDGLVVSGTTGESPTTTVEEDALVLAAVREAVGPDIILVAGVGTNDTKTSVQLATQAAANGADGLLLVTPYYNKPGQRGILNHFRTVVDATDRPVMLYDVPGRTGSVIELSTYDELVKDPRIIAVKDAVGDVVRGSRIIDKGLALYSGDDALNLAWLAHGCSGFVSVAGHVVGDQLRDLWDSYQAGEVTKAREIFLGILPAIDAIMGGPNYGATTAKASLQLLGILDHRFVRSPLSALDDDEYTDLRSVLTAAGLI